MDTAPQMSAETAAEVPYARRAQRRRSLGTWLLVGGVIVVGVALGAGYVLRSTGLLDRVFGRAAGNPMIYVIKPVDLSITLTEDGELKPKNSVEIKCELEGQSTILSVVEESTRVKKGDLLVELASDAIKDRLDSEKIQLDSIKAALVAAQQNLAIVRSENLSQIKKCEIDSEVARLELERYREGDYRRARRAAEIDIEETKMEIKRKREDLEKNQELKEKGFVTASEIELLAFELWRAERQLEQNELQLEILDNYEKPKNETQKESALEQAIQELEREKKRAASREAQAVAKEKEQQDLLETRQRRYDRMEEQYAKCRIYAPVDGVVQYPSDDMGWRGGGNRVAAGEKAYEGQTLIVLPDTSQMIVSTRIHEADRHKVHEGLPCLVKVPAVPGRTFHGQISRIARFADTANRWLNPELKEHTTEVLVDETDAPLSPGDSAEIKVLIEELSNVVAAPVQCVFSRGSKDFVFLHRGGSTEYVEVKLGRSSERLVEIVEGVQEGDEVLMQVSDELVATLPAAGAVEAQMQRLAAPPGPEQRPVQSTADKRRPRRGPPKSAVVPQKGKGKGG